MQLEYNFHERIRKTKVLKNGRLFSSTMKASTHLLNWMALCTKRFTIYFWCIAYNLLKWLQSLNLICFEVTRWPLVPVSSNFNIMRQKTKEILTVLSAKQKFLKFLMSMYHSYLEIYSRRRYIIFTISKRGNKTLTYAVGILFSWTYKEIKILQNGWSFSSTMKASTYHLNWMALYLDDVPPISVLQII